MGFLMGNEKVDSADLKDLEAKTKLTKQQRISQAMRVRRVDNRGMGSFMSYGPEYKAHIGQTIMESGLTRSAAMELTKQYAPGGTEAGAAAFAQINQSQTNMTHTFTDLGPPGPFVREVIRANQFTLLQNKKIPSDCSEGIALN